MILSAISALVFLFATNVGLLLAGRVISDCQRDFTSTATTTIVNLAADDKRAEPPQLQVA